MLLGSLFRPVVEFISVPLELERRPIAAEWLRWLWGEKRYWERGRLKRGSAGAWKQSD